MNFFDLNQRMGKEYQVKVLWKKEYVGMDIVYRPSKNIGCKLPDIYDSQEAREAQESPSPTIAVWVRMVWSSGLRIDWINPPGLDDEDPDPETLQYIIESLDIPSYEECLQLLKSNNHL